MNPKNLASKIACTIILTVTMWSLVAYADRAIQDSLVSAYMSGYAAGQADQDVNRDITSVSTY